MWDASRSCEPDDALVGPRCRPEALRAESVTPGHLWSWETTLSWTLNVTSNVKACWTGEATFHSPYWITSQMGCFITCCLFVLYVFCFCVYTFKKTIKIVTTVYYHTHVQRHSVTAWQSKNTLDTYCDNSIWWLTTQWPLTLNTEHK